jgi:sulfur dioxygenase
MILHQLFDKTSSTYTYLLGDAKTGQALVIDSVLENNGQILRLLQDCGLRLLLAIDTHTHADHITGLGALREQTGCKTMMGAQSVAKCLSGKFKGGDQLKVGEIQIEVIYSPGHTDDSYSFYIADKGILFSGDTLLIGGTGRTDFQNGDAATQYDSLHSRILSLPDSTMLYPAHDYNGVFSSTLGNEKITNPRLQVIDKQAYIKLMESLDLPDPAMMDIAVSANQACGNLKS